MKAGGRIRSVKRTLVWITVLLALCALRMPAAAVQTQAQQMAVQQDKNAKGSKAVFSVMGMSFVLAGGASALIVALDRR